MKILKIFIALSSAILMFSSCDPVQPEQKPGGGDDQETPVQPAGKRLDLAQVDNLIKILPGDVLVHKQEVLRVARGETATLQIAVTALEDVGRVTTSISFKDGSLPASMGWLRYVKSTPYWPDWAGGTPPDALSSPDDMYPDPIMPVDVWNVSLNTGERAVLWTEFSIDRNCAPGLYEGEILFDVEAGVDDGPVALPFAVQVYPAVLPEKQSFTLAQWETGTYDAMNGGTAVEVGSERYFELQANVVRMVSEYGQNSFRLQDGIVPSKITAWYADIENEKDPDTGKPIPSFDFWSKLDPYIQNYLDNCPDVHQIHAPGFVTLDGSRLKAAIGYYDGVNSWPAGKGALPEDPDARHFIKYYFRKLEAHLKSKPLNDGSGRSWFDIYCQSIFDEPTDARAADWNAWAELVKAGSPEMKIVEATNTDKLDPKLCDILCPVLSNLSYTTAQEEQTQWFYTAVIPTGTYANRFVNLPLIKTRLLHWIHYKYNSVGTLHWGLMYWMGVNDPYGEIQGSGLPGGDMFIIYPGNGLAYPSIRLAAMRDGLKDYELLKQLASKSEAEAKALVDKIVYDYSSYNTDVGSFRELRKELLELL